MHATTIPHKESQREGYDEVTLALAEYVINKREPSDEAWQTARLCLADALGCAIAALQLPACQRLIGPSFPERSFTAGGCRIPGTTWELDPVEGAFTLGTMIRWLDFNDTWLAQEWGHPSDNLGGLLTIADWVCRHRRSAGQPLLTIKELLLAMIQAYEIQGIISLSNSFNRSGFDHVILVKTATAAVTTALMGGNEQQIADAIAQTWMDAGPLRTYRHEPNVGARKSWAAGDATSRGVWLSLLSFKAAEGYPTALTVPLWGLQDCILKGKALTLTRELGCYVMENILLKVLYPAEFHAQTAVEAACQLHRIIAGREEQVEKIEIETHEAAMRIINKKGMLRNPADRDHCLQYMVAVALLNGELNAEDYEEHGAGDVRIEALRKVMELRERPQYSKDYLDPERRSIANAITVYFNDSSSTERIAIEYPIGHRRRRQEAIPLLWKKLEKNLCGHYPETKVTHLVQLMQQQSVLSLPVDNFVEEWL